MTIKNKMIFTLGLLTAGVVSAAPVGCAGSPPPAQTVATSSTASSYSFSCGELTFSNFEVVDAGTVLPAIMNLVSAVEDPSLNMVVLNFNPNMYAWPGTVEDLHFYFQVTGGISGIDLAVGGTRSFITEKACATAINRNGGNNCTGGISNELASLTNFSGNSPVNGTFASGLGASPVYIFKDILVDGRRSSTGAELTSFSQSFYTVPVIDDSSVPEPLSMGLMGSGLTGLIVLRRRMKA